MKPRARKITWGIGAALIALGLGALYEAATRPEAPPSARALTPATPTLPFGYRWREGLVLEYALKLDYHSGLQGAGSEALALDGDLQLEGTLRLRILASVGSKAHVEAELSELRLARWRLMGELIPQAQATQAYLEGQRAVLLYEPSGQLIEARFSPQTPRPFANVLDLLMRQLQAPVAPGQARWSERVEAGFGRVETEYTLMGCDDAGCSVEMARDARGYERLLSLRSDAPFEQGEGGGEQRFTISREGHLERCQAKEGLRLSGGGSRAEVSLDAQITLKRRRWETPRRSPVIDEAWVRAQALPDRARENALKARAAGMTFERLRADVLRWGNGGKMPRHERWLWRTTGLLKLKPERAYRMADLFREATLEGRGKALVLDLLANVGHAQAQEVLRELLGDSEVRARADYGALVQRYLLVREPDDASLEFLEVGYREGSIAAHRHATVTALGAALEGASARDPEGALRRVEALRDDMKATSDPTTRRALVSALGSAGRPELLNDILEETWAAEPGVRSAAALALRKLKDPDATARLIELLSTDGDPFVQSAALRALNQRGLAPDQVDALTAGIEAAPLAQQSLRGLVQLLSKQADAAPARTLLAAEALQRRGDLPRPLAHALAALILQLRGAP